MQHLNLALDAGYLQGGWRVVAARVERIARLQLRAQESVSAVLMAVRLIQEGLLLFAIARQIASHALRSAQRRERREREQPGPSASPDPHEALERSEAARFVETFLSRLDEPQATVFVLAEIEGMTAPEIASCLGVGVNTVYSRLRLARERFERALSRHNDRSPS